MKSARDLLCRVECESPRGLEASLFLGSCCSRSPGETIRKTHRGPRPNRQPAGPGKTGGAGKTAGRGHQRGSAKSRRATRAAGRRTCSHRRDGLLRRGRLHDHVQAPVTDAEGQGGVRFHRSRHADLEITDRAGVHPGEGALLAGHDLGVAIAEAGFETKMTVPEFTAAEKSPSGRSSGKAAVVAFLNGYVSQLGKGRSSPSTTSRSSPMLIARTAKVTRGIQKLAVRVRRPTSTAQIYDGPIDTRNLVTLELDTMPPTGEI